MIVTMLFIIMTVITVITVINSMRLYNDKKKALRESYNNVYKFSYNYNDMRTNNK